MTNILGLYNDLGHCPACKQNTANLEVSCTNDGRTKHTYYCESKTCGVVTVEVQTWHIHEDVPKTEWELRIVWMLEDDYKAWYHPNSGDAYEGNDADDEWWNLPNDDDDEDYAEDGW